MTIVTTKLLKDILHITINNPPVNATSLAVRQGLMDAVGEAETARAVILRCEGRTFIAGGDITEFDRPAEAPLLPDVVAAIEQSAASGRCIWPCANQQNPRRSGMRFLVSVRQPSQHL